jgi:hypothetical protein
MDAPRHGGQQFCRAPRSAASLAAVILLCITAAASAQVIVPDVKVGYIDSAVVNNQFRVQFDSGYGLFPPDRAEFFYAKCGCFRLLDPTNPLFDPDAPGPTGVETNIDYQEASIYVEQTASDWFSGFIETPIRFINPEVNDNTAGLGDLQTGGKVLLWWAEDTWITFQLRTYIPTGDADRGLGTHHVSLEPGILFFHQLTDRLTVEGEVRDWIPIGGTDFAGNIIRYGLGAGYSVLDPCASISAAPVVEAVGWTVLGGKKLETAGPEDAAGDTILNLKMGIRVGFGPNKLHQIYAGYGRALTDEHWYEDIARVQYRVFY